MRLSEPSREKLFAPMNFFRMNSSNITAAVSRVRMRTCWSRRRSMWFSHGSILTCSQRRMVTSSMCMYSTPMERQ